MCPTVHVLEIHLRRGNDVNIGNKMCHCEEATVCCVFALWHVSSQPYTTLPPEWLHVVFVCQTTAHHFILS